MAGDFVDNMQREMLRNQIAERFPDIALADYSSWEDLLKMLNKLADKQFTLCLDEFPYMVKHSNKDTADRIIALISDIADQK